MKKSERIRRIQEVERAAKKLFRKGWRVETVQHTDESGEPFRICLNLAIDRDSKMGGVL